MKSTISMVWHIFKKDCRLLWPFILGAAGVQFAYATMQYLIDHGRETETLSALFRLLQFAPGLAVGFLIATVVHQEALPGVRQDWLVRPVRRLDLLLAKLLFVLVVVHGPILLADTSQALVNGFPLSQSLASAVMAGLMVLIWVSLPVLAFSSLTRNMTDTIMGGVALAVGVVAVSQFLSGRRAFPPTQGTGLAWIAQSVEFVALLLGAGIILTLQYFRRKTVLARWLTVGIVCSAFLVQFVPWQSAFALQQRLSPAPGAGRMIIATYEPSLGKFRLPEGISHRTISGNGDRQRDEASAVYLPMHLAGLPDDGVLNADRAQVRLLAADGKVLYQGPGDDLLVRKEGHLGPVHFTIGSRSSGMVRDIGPKDLSLSQDGETRMYQGIALPRRLYDRIKNQPLTVEIDYSLTLLEGDVHTIPALGGKQALPGVGRCTTKMDDDGDDINLFCMQAGVPPFCASAFLEHVPSGRRNPTAFSCRPSYSPYVQGYDGLARFGAGVRFHDLSGLIQYPVDAAQLPESRVVIRAYKAQDHFTRQLVILQIRLSDWESIERTQVAENR
jgi:hypothetical protein